MNLKTIDKIQKDTRCIKITYEDAVTGSTGVMYIKQSLWEEKSRQFHKAFKDCFFKSEIVPLEEFMHAERKQELRRYSR